MSAKTELYAIARDLREYIKWHEQAGAVGSVPATDEQREAFEALAQRREDRELAAARRKIMGEEPQEASAPPEASAPKATRSETPAPDTSSKRSKPSKSPKSSKPSKPTGGSDNPAEDFRKRFEEAAEEKPAETLEADKGEDQPWKSIGSRPTPRFAKKKKEADVAKKKSEKQSEKSQSSNNSSPADGPQYNENAYPEASGVMMEGAVDMGDPGGGNAPPEAASSSKKPQKSEQPEKSGKPKKSKADMTNAEKLEFLEEYLGDCRRCGLCESRSNIVFGDGTADARLVFVGEAPRYNEDKQGLPFVGDAGQLLDKMIEAMGLERGDVYICNLIKCRPPKNRDPQPDEITECSPFLRKQLEVISPAVIVSLGTFASQWLLESDDAMGRMRGSWHEWNGTPVMPTYHPAYLLRHEDQKRKTWSDLQTVMERLGL